MFKKLFSILKTFFSIAFCLATQFGFCQNVNDGDNLYLYTKSANEAAIYSLDEINKITFNKNGIQIWNTNWPTEYNYSNVRILTFSDKGSSSQSKVESVNGNNSDIDIVYNASSSTLTVNSSRLMKGVVLYNTKGMLILSDMMQKHKYRLHLSDQPSGIYIVKVFGDGRTVSKKITK